MVLAVYMPPHEPGPGQAWHSMAYSSSSSMSALVVLAHRLEDADDVDVAPVEPAPGRMVPP